MLRWIKEKLVSRFPMVDMGDVSLVLGMGVTRDREKGTVTVTRESYKPLLSGTIGKLQSYVHAWCGKKTVSGPAGRGA